MPGIVGIIHNHRVPISLSTALGKLMHFPSYRSNEIAVSTNVTLGQVWRHELHAPEQWYFDEERQTGILINGTILSATKSPRQLRPFEVLNDYTQQGVSHWKDYDGAFHIVIVDLLKKRFIIGNDRLGVLPLYYMTDEGAFCFGPEVKALLNILNTPAQLSTTGMVTFLAAGYCLGETTLFDNVKILEPSTVLSIDINTLAVEKDRIWRMKYEPDRYLQSRKIAHEVLADAVIEAHKLILHDKQQQYDLLLSGGLDSRCILAVLDQFGCPPKRAIGYGLRKDIPHSDAYTAEKLAQEYHVPFEFAAYDTDEFLQNAESWCYISELANDNYGWCSEGVSTLHNLYDITADFSLIGDECWGWQGYVFSEVEARAAVMPPSLPSAVRTVIPEHMVEECEYIYDQQIRDIVQNSGYHNWVDYKDYLYIYGRVARFIFSMGYYKELATELRRPLLANGVLEVIRRLPVEHRVNKNLYISMLYRFFPRVMSIPNKSVNSLPDYRHDLLTNPSLRQYFLKLYDYKRIASGPLGELINGIRFEQLRNNFFASEPHPTQRIFTIKARLKKAWSPITSRARSYAQLMSIIRRRKPPESFNSFDLLRRVALIVLLQEQLSSFTGGTQIEKSCRVVQNDKSNTFHTTRQV